MIIERYKLEIDNNLRLRRKKPVLAKIYNRFQQIIAENLFINSPGKTVEIGSGIGSMKETIPDCICTDLFPNHWIDCVANAYRMPFKDASIANLIMFDVFHHIEYPGAALNEFSRILIPGGRILLFDPCVSLLGLIVYGLFHHEPLALRRPIRWLPPEGWDPERAKFYAAQGNAWRIFFLKKYRLLFSGHWRLVKQVRISSISYVAAGGFSGPQLYPDSAYDALQSLDALCAMAPSIFSTRLLIVLDKKNSPS